MAKVRRIARRELARGSILSDEPEWRSLQIRFLSVFGTLTFLFLLMAHDKFVRLWGSPVYVVELVLFAGAAVLGVRWYLASQVVRRPKEPQDEELELNPTAVELQLASGQLKPLDLVHERGTWTTLIESIQFAEVAEPSHRRSQARARVVMALMVVGGLAVALGAVLFVLNLGAILMWLAN
ncbi:MAG: hypothetical protein QM817_37745 [Archangium sp.]